VPAGSSRAVVAGVGTAVPACTLEQQAVFPLIKQHYGDALRPRSLSVLEQVLAHPSIRTRHVAVDSLHDIARIKTETFDERMDRFTRWSVDLCEKAVRTAVGQARVALEDVVGIVVCTCTGYICPGISTYLIERLGLSRGVRALDLVGAGCGASLPTLQMGEAILGSVGRGAVVCAAVEICSATFEMADDIALLISNAIFGDGAAAVVLTGADRGLEVGPTGGRYHPEYREDVRFVYRNGRLHNRLSPSLPDTTGQAAAAFVRDFLAEQRLALSDIDHWAIHPGGEKILSAVQQRLGLSDAAMRISRSVLADYGNMSSPTVLFELERTMAEGIRPGGNCLLLAFGAGMSIHAALLRQAA
jgi:predicted naringenin-chalcone synthase